MTIEQRIRAAWQVLRSPTGTDGSAPPYWTEDLERIIRSHQTKLPRFEKVLDWLDIRPGMTIADIGAGTGQQSYKLAERLQGKGRVFATDMNPRFVAYMAQQARQRGLSNLEAVLVKGNQRDDELDDFYGRHRFDLILLYDVTPYYIVHRLPFYRRLSQCLTPQGRMVVVGTETPNLRFFREDFQDWEGFLSALKSEPLETPFGWNLRRPLQPLLDAQARGEAVLLERAVLFHVNRIMELPFFIHFVEGLELKPGLAFTAEELPYAQWLLSRVGLAGLPGERVFGSMPLREFRASQRLNKLLIIQRFRPFLRQDGRCPYESAAEESRWHRESDVIGWELETAGFERKWDLPPCQAVWVLTAGGARPTPRPHPFMPPRPHD